MGDAKGVLISFMDRHYTQSHRFQFGEAEESFGGEEQVQFVKAIVGESSLEGYSTQVR